MNEIRCPKCGTVFTVDESGYADIVRQVRDEQFARDLHEREELMAREKEQELALVRETAQRELQAGMAERDTQIAELKAQLAAADEQRDLAREQAAAEAREQVRAEAADERERAQKDAAALQRQVDALTAELERQKDAAKLADASTRQELAHDVAARDAQIAELKAQLAAADDRQALALDKAAAEAERRLGEQVAKAREEAERLRSQLREQEGAAKLAQAEAVAAVERERDEARSALVREQAVRDSEKRQMEATHTLELEQARKSAESLIRYKDEEIERLRDMKARLSTKMVGETLEQHCETEFNRLRMTAFPRAYFEKDNDASDGTKGDFIFRECDEAGNEVVSIMFEMKNENDETATKHKNEDFFKKLDADRTKKGCEYAVLVTLLEPESELYNTGIVDVSYRYPKMYVIRPQFFIPLITLLRNAAMNALAYKQELAIVRQQNIDVTHFEEKLLKFQGGFSRNFELASRKFQTAIDEIDATIKHLQKVKDNLISSENNLRLANDKAQDLTIRKLTWGNKTMKEAFDAARAERAAEDAEAFEAVDAEVTADADAAEPGAPKAEAGE
ncbi:DUF2130 domain-containing protein [Collinsella intestinalis]|uniref:DUF2130 domain-containing protein n=1 Tax=Collinsella intestinalis TaxID=147207 RepID=UPI0019574F4C|nr:DUF2130 domain-containing protein [Collinsella intestinalis]MBM6683354.1 DUF2130 domain-containing protein [Collinsella intestinalis]